MKKVLIGCGIVSLLFVVLAVGGMIYAGMKVKQFAQGWEKAAADIERLDAKYPFTSPADGALAKDRLDAYFKVRDSMLQKVQGNATVQKIISAKGGAAPNIGVGEMIGLVASFPREMMEEFSLQLEKHQMSPAEFTFNTEAIYSAISAGKKSADPAMTEIYNKFQVAVDGVSAAFKDQRNSNLQLNFSGTLDTLREQAQDVVSRNIELVKAHRDQLMDFPEVGYMELLMLSQRGATQATFRPAAAPAAPAPAGEPVPASP